MSNPGRTIANVQPPPSPAGAGNLRAVRHGARSELLVAPRARELAAAVLDANAHLDADRDGAGVARYAMLLARVERVYVWLSEQPDDVFADLDAGRAHGVYERLERWERACAEAEQRLAIAPLTRARLGLDLVRGFDLALAMAADAEAEAREREAAGDG